MVSITVITLVLAAMFIGITVAIVAMSITLLYAFIKGSNVQINRDKETEKTAEDEVESLKQKYLNDEISEEEFEDRIGYVFNRDQDKNVERGYN